MITIREDVRIRRIPAHARVWFVDALSGERFPVYFYATRRTEIAVPVGFRVEVECVIEEIGARA